MKIVAVSQARSGSTRLPGKVLMEINGETLLGLHIQRVKQSNRIDQFVVATTTHVDDKKVEEIALQHNVDCFRGDENDVLDRYFQAVRGYNPDYVVRITSDCPLLDATLINAVIDCAIEKDLDYCANTMDPSYPDGQDVEVFKFSALEKAWNEAKLASEREHVTPFIWKNSSYKGGNLFKSDNFTEGHDFAHVRMTVDEQADFDVIAALIEELGTDKDWLTYTNHLLNHPEIFNKNAQIRRNEGFTKSINKDTYVK